MSKHCEGPMIWFEVDLIDSEGEKYVGVILECKCGQITLSGSYFDEEHQSTPIMREGV